MSHSLQVTFCAYDWPNNVAGPSSWLVRLLPELRHHGIEPRCLLLCWGRSGPVLTDLRARGIPCVDVVSHSDTQSRMDWILEHLIESPPEVFVPNLSVPALFVSRYARQAGIPTVAVLHSDDDFYRGVVEEFVVGDRRRAVSDVVCVSRELERQLRELEPRDTRVRRIAYGVPIPSRAVRRDPEAFRIAYVGRLSEQQKRISDLTRAFCTVAAEIPGTRCSIIGDGPDRAAVEAVLRSEGEGLPVRLVGRVANDRVQELLLDQDAIVLLSEYEGLPIAILEAMACGTVPVCLRSRSGIPELVEDGVTGILIDNRGDDLLAAVRRLKEDLELWSRLSRAAQERVTSENSNEACVTRWASLLWSLHRNASAAGELKRPRGFRLPPVNPKLAAEDPRRQVVRSHYNLYRKGRGILGRAARSLRRGLSK